MSRRNEDFDEFCDPENPRLIMFDDVVDAAKRMKPYIITAPCVPSFHQKNFAMNLYYKLEFLQKSGSFKDRGALNALQLLPLDKKKIGIVVASLGNEALAFCYHASKLSVPIIVVMPVTVPASRFQKCHSLGAKVIVQGQNLMEAQKYARGIAREKGFTFINGRDNPHVLSGYGTVALEILEQAPFVDAIIVPVGSGGLAAAVTRVVKQLKPACLVYGVQPECNSGFFNALKAEEMQIFPVQTTLADSIAVPNIGCNAFYNTQPLLDKMLLVNENWIARSILHLTEKEKYVVEGAGACPLATIIGNLVPELKLKNVVCVLSGGNVDSILYGRCIDRGLTAEGRLMKFRVGIKMGAYPQLLQLLTAGGYDLVSQHHTTVCTENDTFVTEKKIVCVTYGLEHALELKRIMDKAYPCSTTFETEPFNDKRTCPCYVRKSM